LATNNYGLRVGGNDDGVAKAELGGGLLTGARPVAELEAVRCEL